MHLSPGQRLGPYEIVCRVGAGCMGEVYRAREAQTLAALNHPDIAQISIAVDDRNERRAVGDALAERVDATAVHRVGKILILWRPRAEDA